MEKLSILETPVLVDLLAAQTADYIRMLSEGATEEDYARCNLFLRAIQTEIEARRLTEPNTSATDSDFTNPDYLR